jgi:hypothetical protein
MTAMIRELYEALKEAGASEEKAGRAAEAIAGYENRFSRIETDLTLIKWMLGFNLALSVAILVKLMV